MAAPMVKTATPGIYKRGSRYVATWWVKGKVRKKSARTLSDARAIKASREAEIASGEYQEASRVKFREYAEEWIELYNGRGRSGFRESTRDDYRRDLRWYAFPYFDERLDRRLTELSPRDIDNWIGWICDEEEQGRRRAQQKRERAIAKGKKPPTGPPKPVVLSDTTVRRILAPVRACLASARRQDLIRRNPADAASLPHRPRVDAEPVKARALTREQLAGVLRIVKPKHRLLLQFLAGTGVRWGEAAALRWEDLHLDGSSPHVKVRRAYSRGVIGPPKSRYAIRDIPLGSELVFALRARRKETEWGGEEDLVFVSEVGGPLDHGNMLRRVLRPAAEEAGAPWAGFHAFRHTCASMLFERGANAVKVQRWLGHHSPAFTLDTYIHLLDDQLDEPLDITAELAEVGRSVGRYPTGNDRNGSIGSDAATPQPTAENPEPAGSHRSTFGNS